MKKLLLLSLTMFLSVLVHADKVEINGIYYFLTTKAKQAKVTSSPNHYSGSIDIPSTVEYEGISYNVTKIGEEAFRNCESVTSIFIPNSIIDIEARAFMSCNFESIIIPNSVKKIGKEAFYHCQKLASITIGNGLEKFDKKVFEDCVSLNKVVVKDLAAWCRVEFNSNPLRYAKHLYSDENTEITELVIPDGITSISANAFQGCNNITSLTIPNSVEIIGSEAFGGLGITSVTIPNKVTYLSGFGGCTNLKSFTIPQSVTTIGMDAFFGCTGITSIEIPNSVTSIEQSAFSNTNLTSVVIPNSVTDIGYWAFNCCAKLTSVTLGNAVRSIGYWAFANCQELYDVYCHPEQVPYADINAFQYSLIEYVTLHVPEAAIDSYKTTAPWSGFKEVVAISPSGMSKLEAIETSVKCEDGQLTIEGIDDGQLVELYSLNGEKRGSAISKNGAARIDTNVRPGSIVVVKMGEKSVKVIVK